MLRGCPQLRGQVNSRVEASVVHRGSLSFRRWQHCRPCALTQIKLTGAVPARRLLPEVARLRSLRQLLVLLGDFEQDLPGDRVFHFIGSGAHLFGLNAPVLGVKHHCTAPRPVGRVDWLSRRTGTQSPAIGDTCRDRQSLPFARAPALPFFGTRPLSCEGAPNSARAGAQ